MSSAHYFFIGQGRRPLIMTLFAGAIFFHKRYPLWMRLIVFVLAFSMLKVFFKYWKLPDFLVIGIIPILFVMLLKLAFFDVYKTDKKSGSVISIFSIFITFHLFFYSAQFDSLRYLLCIVPVYIMMSLYFTQKIFWLRNIALPIISIVAICFSSFYMMSDSNVGDDTNNYSNDCEIRLEAINSLEENYAATHLIRASFLMKHALERPLAGYLRTDKVFKNVKPVISNAGHSGLYVFCSMEPSVYYEKVKNNKKMKLLQHFQKENVWIEIYTKK
jgi:hypothetical protein